MVRSSGDLRHDPRVALIFEKLKLPQLPLGEQESIAIRRPDQRNRTFPRGLENRHLLAPGIQQGEAAREFGSGAAAKSLLEVVAKGIQMDDRGNFECTPAFGCRPLRVRLRAAARLVLGMKDERDGVFWNLLPCHARTLATGRDKHQPRGERKQRTLHDSEETTVRP